MPEPTDPDRALRRAGVELELHVAASGWDQPVRVFALVPTAELLEAAPHLAEGVDRGALGADSLTPVEQEDLPDEGDGLDGLLARLAWPETVAGAAVSVERIVVPPSAERDLPEDPDAALEHLASHPERRDVRLIVLVTREGASFCLLRQRDHDTPDQVAVGPDIAPGLVAALKATFEPDPATPHR